VNFEAWLISKKVDRDAFSKAEGALFNSWRSEFDQMHPNSFTIQKLNLINPIRRKYPLKAVAQESKPSAPEAPAPAAASPKPAKPVIKPKPKIT
jgi:hypothetical protein